MSYRAAALVGTSPSEVKAGRRNFLVKFHRVVSSLASERHKPKGFADNLYLL